MTHAQQGWVRGRLKGPTESCSTACSLIGFSSPGPGYPISHNSVNLLLVRGAPLEVGRDVPSTVFQRARPGVLGVLASVSAFHFSSQKGWQVGLETALLEACSDTSGFLTGPGMRPPFHLDVHRSAVPSPMTWSLGFSVVQKHGIL